MKFALTKEYTGRRLTWPGRLLILLIMTGLAVGAVANLYPFLAPDAEPKGGLMVVEGWIHDFALDEAVAMYRSGNYTRIVCTGVPIETGSYIQEYASYPQMTAARLRKLGIPSDAIVVAVAEVTPRDRTYASAVALREAIMAYNIQETDLHLVTTGPHGRRSRMLFRKALDGEYNIGITCIEAYNYRADNWFTSSEGVRSVLGELIAYIYAKFFFHP